MPCYTPLHPRLSPAEAPCGKKIVVLNLPTSVRRLRIEEIAFFQDFLHQRTQIGMKIDVPAELLAAPVYQRCYERVFVDALL